MRPTSAIVAALFLLLGAAPAPARGLSEIKASGTLAVCAHPNALPFSAKEGKRHGFQVDMAEALAHQLGVSLTREWIISRYDLFRAPCDVVMDSIADPEAQEIRACSSRSPIAAAAWHWSCAATHAARVRSMICAGGGSACSPARSRR